MSESGQNVLFYRSVITPETDGVGGHKLSPEKTFRFVPNIT